MDEGDMHDAERSAAQVRALTRVPAAHSFLSRLSSVVVLDCVSVRIGCLPSRCAFSWLSRIAAFVCNTSRRVALFTGLRRRVFLALA